MGVGDIADPVQLVVGPVSAQPSGDLGAFPAKLADLVQSTQRTSPRELEALLADGEVTVIDVRGKGDRACGTIPKAIEIALLDLRGRMHAIPTDKPIVVHSAAAGLSSTAAPLLRANGLADVSDLTGGFRAVGTWHPAHENRQATQDGHVLTPCERHPAAPQDRRQTLNHPDTRSAPTSNPEHKTDYLVRGLHYFCGAH